MILYVLLLLIFSSRCIPLSKYALKMKHWLRGEGSVCATVILWPGTWSWSARTTDWSSMDVSGHYLAWWPHVPSMPLLGKTFFRGVLNTSWQKSIRGSTLRRWVDSAYETHSRIQTLVTDHVRVDTAHHGIFCPSSAHLHSRKWRQTSPAIISG